ncbi:two-component system sensor histidine kinase NtrB [Jannaschia rubra]|uniref:two-component system sensor histidine kinase NtrB n=1 Tax=Jannaschia rubra TaxID=282197 RepID=UPI00248FA499|nr:ATP-binding protein [Jannaschia rubra]
MTGPDVWQALPIPALVLDGADRVAAVNGPAEGMFNRSARSLTGRAFPAILDLDGGVPAATARVRATGAPLTLHEVTIRPAQAPAIRCEVHLAPLDDGVLILMSPQDIAGRFDSTDHARTAARSAIGMAEMLAHEIKNPLAGITGAAQLLGMGLAGEDLELTGLIVAESRRIVKLLEQVEQFGNLRPPDRHAINIHDVLDRARRSALVGFAAHVDIVENYDPSLPPTWADPDQLLQVVLNLLKNAAQVADRKGKVTIRTFYEPGLWVRRADGTAASLPLQVEIVDDGPGIPPAIAASIFEPFVSGRENGTGLGLALVSKIVNDHDAWISASSVPGRTVMRLSLPLAPKDMKIDPQAIGAK